MINYHVETPRNDALKNDVISERLSNVMLDNPILLHPTGKPLPYITLQNIVDTITYTTTNSLCFTWHPYVKQGL